MMMVKPRILVESSDGSFMKYIPTVLRDRDSLGFRWDFAVDDAINDFMIKSRKEKLEKLEKLNEI